jgi:riboflavin kinase/FMN adenylyltransferase
MHLIPEPDLNIVEFSALKPLVNADTTITIGNFDGVHRGHQAVIEHMLEMARAESQAVIVLTFYPNPAVFFNQPVQPFYLSSPREKESQLLALGVDRVITFRFDREFAELTPEVFVLKLQETLGLRVLVVGQDFALGKGRQGTIPYLNQLGDQYGFEVRVIPHLDYGEQEISSSRIRNYLDAGAVDEARKLLGRPYRVTGEVAHGSDRGKKIGLPTANVAHWPGKKLPAVGVYATLVNLEGEVYQGITNVGYRPTFEEQTRVDVEAYILDFSQDIYGQSISLDFIQKIRDEQKFSGVDALLAQIERDKAQAKRIFQND